jgi:replicative DNA helicase
MAAPHDISRQLLEEAFYDSIKALLMQMAAPHDISRQLLEEAFYDYHHRSIY